MASLKLDSLSRDREGGAGLPRGEGKVAPTEAKIHSGRLRCGSGKASCACGETCARDHLAGGTYRMVSKSNYLSHLAD